MTIAPVNLQKSISHPKVNVVMSCVMGLLMCFSISTSGITATETAAEFDARITRELDAVDAEAARLFTQANDRRKEYNLQSAIELYGRVLERVPTFDHAARRLGSCYLVVQRRKLAEEWCRRALELNQSPYNKMALAVVLASGGESGHPTSAEAEEATRLGDSAAAEARTDGEVILQRCQIALGLSDFENLDAYLRIAEELVPDRMELHYYKAVNHLARGNTLRARWALEKAHQLGLNKDAYERLDGLLQNNKPLSETLLLLGTRLVVGWLIVLLLIFGASFVASRFTLNAANRLATHGDTEARAVSRTLRVGYLVLLFLSWLTYYVSLPIVMTFVVLVGGGILYAMYLFGWYHLGLAAAAALIIIGGLIALSRAFWTRSDEEDPEFEIDLGEQEKLKGVLAEVADRVGVRSIDRLFLTTGTDFAVSERGSLLRQMAGRGERCMVIGAGLLNGFQPTSFRSILAHEYGHFLSKDNAGGRMSLAVRRSLAGVANELASGGQDNPLNPAWLFANLYWRLFSRVSQGASRLQEILADRMAIRCYGSKAFIDGLTHIITRDELVNYQMQSCLKAAFETGTAVHNLFVATAKIKIDQTMAEETLDKTLKRSQSAHDSHPTPQQRIEWAKIMACPGPIGEETGDAWDYLVHGEEIQRKLTLLIRGRMDGKTRKLIEPPPRPVPQMRSRPGMGGKQVSPAPVSDPDQPTTSAEV